MVQGGTKEISGGHLPLALLLAAPMPVYLEASYFGPDFNLKLLSNFSPNPVRKPRPEFQTCIRFRKVVAQCFEVFEF